MLEGNLQGRITLPDPKSAATPDRILRIGRPTGGIQDLTVQGQHAASPLPSRCAEPRRSHKLAPSHGIPHVQWTCGYRHTPNPPLQGEGDRAAQAAWWRGMHLSATGKPRTGIPLHHRLRRRSPPPAGRIHPVPLLAIVIASREAARQSSPPRASHPGLDRVPGFRRGRDDDRRDRPQSSHKFPRMLAKR